MITNEDILIAYQKAYDAEYRLKIAAQKRAYYNANNIRVKARIKAWRSKHANASKTVHNESLLAYLQCSI